MLIGKVFLGLGQHFMNFALELSKEDSMTVHDNKAKRIFFFETASEFFRVESSIAVVGEFGEGVDWLDCYTNVF